MLYVIFFFIICEDCNIIGNEMGNFVKRIAKVGLDTSCDVCIACTHLGVVCSGPDFSVMTTECWCEWVWKRREYLRTHDGTHWNNQYIADLAGISKATMDRIIAGNVTGLTVETKYRVTYVMVFCRKPGEDPVAYPCAMAAFGLIGDVSPSELIAENERLKEDAKCINDRIESQYRALLDAAHNQNALLTSQLEIKDEQIREMSKFMKIKDRRVGILATSLGVSVLAALLLIIL